MRWYEWNQPPVTMSRRDMMRLTMREKKYVHENTCAPVNLIADNPTSVVMLTLLTLTSTTRSKYMGNGLFLSATNRIPAKWVYRKQEHTAQTF